MFTTVSVKVSVTEPAVVASSVAVTTTVWAPTSALVGVPDNTPALDIVRAPELGSPDALYVIASPVSPSAKLLEMSRL